VLRATLLALTALLLKSLLLKKLLKKFKLKIIDQSDKSSNRDARRKLGVLKSYIRDWKKGQSKETPTRSKCLPGRGHMACSPCMKEALSDWIDSQ